jgi:hypothetical protein
MYSNFIAYSSITTEPVPIMYRPDKQNALKKADLEKRLRWVAPEVCDMLIQENGASVGPGGEIVFPLPDKEACDRLKKDFETNTDFIHVSWDTYNVYKQTSLTEKLYMELSHADYVEFVNKVVSLKDCPVPFIPAFIKSIVCADECFKCLQDLNKIRDYFVGDAFFNALHKLMSLGADCGFIMID